MTLPIYLRVGNNIINLSRCNGIMAEDETLRFCYVGEENIELEYDSSEDAEQALNEVQEILVGKNLLVGAI
jgi:hypothetical protein